MAEVEEKRNEAKEMKPWEQHAAVIRMPRFDYNAPSALLHHSLSGFLITCSIKREKSATKEAMLILEKYVESYNSVSSDSLESSNANINSKRRKVIADETAEVKSKESKDVIEDRGGISNDDCLALATTNANAEKDSGLSLVKLTRSGLVLLTFPAQNSVDTVDIVSSIFQSLESGTSKSPQWCHRIFPIQATCQLNEKELQTVVSKLVLQFMSDERNIVSRPVKFAIGYNRRGVQETEKKTLKVSLNDTDALSLLDRNRCFDTVARGVKEVVSDSVVDLKSPEISILVELLPLSGVPNGSLVTAVSVLPQNLISVKPRLCIKALISDVKVNKNSKESKVVRE